MAHLILQLGGSVVVPFRAPQGTLAPRARDASARRLRWRALLEAAEVAESVDAVFCAMRLAQGRVLHPLFGRDGGAARKGVSQ